MPLIPLPAFSDNYIWLLNDQHRLLAVDPGEGAAVLNWVANHPGMQLDTILVTHHHADHTGGLAELVQATGARVYGPALEKLPVDHTPVVHGQSLSWGNLTFQVMDVPGHTLGHVAYWAQPAGQTPLLFCGDTLFSAGCGRLFEGSPAQMLASLDQLSALPPDTRVCCAHEYTLSNLKFALAVEPDNADLQAYAGHCHQRRSQSLPTLPVALSTEQAINPFLRTRHPAVRQSIQQHRPEASDDVSVFAALRQWKNEFQ
jgi:hydroxyacylglutathione hydrolase